MKREEIEARVDEIRQLADDDEVAHVREKDLWEQTLRAIAEGAPNSDELANAALKTLDIAFSRWFA